MRTKDSTLRAFIAIDLPSTALQTLGQTQDHFKSLDLHASWVCMENIHLTLKFLGDIDADRVTEIQTALSTCLGSFPHLPVALGHLGVFPHPRKPRVLWVNLKGSEEELAQLHRELDKVMAVLGFPPEKHRFSPHLTLARIKSTKNINKLTREMESHEGPEPVKFEISSVKLYKSQLTPKGSIYTVLGDYELRG